MSAYTYAYKKCAGNGTAPWLLMVFRDHDTNTVVWGNFRKTKSELRKLLTSARKSFPGLKPKEGTTPL